MNKEGKVEAWILGTLTLADQYKELKHQNKIGVHTGEYESKQFSSSKCFDVSSVTYSGVRALQTEVKARNGEFLVIPYTYIVRKIAEFSMK